MGEVASADYVDAFDLCPLVQRLQVEVFAGSPRVVGMDVEVSDVGHRAIDSLGHRVMLRLFLGWCYP